MLKNERMIGRMSTEQKIGLITSTRLFGNSSVAEYGFPQFTLEESPLAEKENPVTRFPTEETMARSWNLPLVHRTFRAIGIETKAITENAYFNITNRLEGVSSEDLFNAEFSAAKVRGLNASGVRVNLQDESLQYDLETVKERIRLITETILAKSSPDSVLRKYNPQAELYEEENILKSHRFHNVRFGIASSKEEAVQLLYAGNSLIFLSEDFSGELLPYLLERISAHKRAFADYKSGKTDLNEFERLTREFEILDEGVIDAACDEVLELLIALGEQSGNIYETPKTLRNTPPAALFDEPEHDRLACQIARQSAVLLKNMRALPIAENTRIAIVGDYAKNPAYQLREGETYTSVKTAFELINDYPINTVGYAHGYCLGEQNSALLETAQQVCKNAEYVLLYLCAAEGESRLPSEQLSVIDSLYSSGAKLIAVVAGDANLDLSFIDKCVALLWTQRSGQGVTAAALDILVGKVNPSGRLVRPLSVTQDNGNKNVYPVGFGLSYTSFAYKNLTISSRGIRCRVDNTGTFDGYATVQLYVRQEDAKSVLRENVLRGFQKIFIKHGDAAIVEIPFDEMTFRSYDAKQLRNHVAEGDYIVSVGESAEDLRLSGSLSLAECTFTEESFGNSSEGKTADVNGTFRSFTSTKDKADFYKEKKGWPFSLKLSLAIIFWLYFGALCAALAFGNLLETHSLVTYCVIGAVGGLVTIAVAAYIAVISVRYRRNRGTLEPAEVLSDMLEHVKPFQEIAKINYCEPVEETEEGEESAEETETAEEVGEAAAECGYEARFSVGDGEEIVYKNEATFGELCANFIDYVSAQGVAVEAASARGLLSAIFSGKFVWLNSGNKEVLPAFLDAVASYFGAAVIAADDEWKKNDLLWRAEENRFVPSEFANRVHKAAQTRERNAAVVLTNVRPQTMYSYFSDFIEYALYPSEAHLIALGAETTLRLPDNLCYILVPADDDYAEHFNRDLADASLCVDVMISKTETNGREVEVKSVARESLTEMLKETGETHYLSEKFWRKTDELAEAVCTNERFYLGNKNVVTLEKFTSVLLECGADESEAFTAMFTAKIVPLLKTLKLYRAENGAKTVFGLIEKIFGDEDVEKVKRMFFGAQL